MKNKKGVENVAEQVIYLLVALVFFVFLLFFVNRTGSGALFLEQVYAKEIGLLIDQAKPGTLIYVDISDGYKIAKDNNLALGDIVKINKNEVVIRLSQSKGYSFKFFSDLKINEPTFGSGNPNVLIISIGEKTKEEGNAQ